MVLAFMVGSLMFLEGIIKLAERGSLRKLDINTGWLTFSVVIDTLFGTGYWALPELGISYMWVVFSILFIFDSALELWGSKFIPQDRKGYYWLTTIFSIIGIILGFILLFNPVLAIQTILLLVAFYLTFFCILQVIKSF